MQQHVLTRGFTLVELLVVVSILSILSTAIFFYAAQAGKTGRDADRQADLQALQSAIELYKQRVGRYPAGCNGADQWSGEVGTSYECPSASSVYILGLAPTYIPVLPRDPKRACDTDCGYAYVTNTDGTTYKLVARKTVESEIVDYNHPMRSCDIKLINPAAIVPNGSQDIRIVGFCGRLRTGPLDSDILFPYFPATATNYSCRGRTLVTAAAIEPFNTTYGVWGGFAPLRATVSNSALCYGGTKCIDENSTSPLSSFVGSPTAAEQHIIRVDAVSGTTEIICK